MDDYAIIGEITAVESIVGLSMITPRQTKCRFAVCVDNTGYPASLELHKIYRVVDDPEAKADGDLRVVDESGEDYLYSQSRFVFIRVPDEVRESLLHVVQ